MMRLNQILKTKSFKKKNLIKRNRKTQIKKMRLI